MNASIPHAQQTWPPRCQHRQAAQHYRCQSTVKHHARQESRLPICHSSSAEYSLQLSQPADQQHLEHSHESQNGSTLPPAGLMESRQHQALVVLQSKLAMMQSERQRRKQLWKAAIKPPMYTVAYVPILVRCLLWAHCTVSSDTQSHSKWATGPACVQVSAAAAYSLTGIFPISQFFQLLGASTLIIAWLNLR